jgi:predicted small lipoprotein YifL
MKRALTLVAVLVGIALALTGCGRHPLRAPATGGEAPPAAASTPTSGPGTGAAGGTGATGATGAGGDLSSVDSDLSTVDSQLAQSDQASDADN